MGKNRVIIVGAGGHALVVADAVRASGDDVVGFVDMVAPQRKGELFCGSPIIGCLDDFYTLPESEKLFVAFGFGHCMARYRLMGELNTHNVQLHTVIHPRAFVSPSARIGHGVYIGPNAVVEAQCDIGAGTIINNGVCVCHGSSIGCAVAICPGVMIGGQTIIGDKTWLGIGSTCIDKIRIGDNSFIGAGSVVVSNMPENCFAIGVPARVLKPMVSEF
jgi:sugar O-acyltransferase (sialic acid O-acetyltransferase NeuD family)